MNHPINELHKKTSLTAKLFLATALMAVTSISMAEDDNVAYVDSVLKWGAWELDIEPAAGGISPPTPRALNTRSAKVALRTNSIAALAPTAPAAVITRAPTPIIPPATPPVSAPVKPPATTFAPSDSVTGQTFLPPASPNIFPASNAAK